MRWRHSRRRILQRCERIQQGWIIIQCTPTMVGEVQHMWPRDLCILCFPKWVFEAWVINVPPILLWWCPRAAIQPNILADGKQFRTRISILTKRWPSMVVSHRSYVHRSGPSRLGSSCSLLWLERESGRLSKILWWKKSRKESNRNGVHSSKVAVLLSFTLTYLFNIIM